MRTYAFILFFAAAGATSAQQMSTADKMALRDNCKQDIQRLCPDAKPGGGAVMACVKEKKEQLSKACSATITEIMAKKQD